MHLRLLCVALLLAACSGPIARELSPSASGLNVAEAALRGGSPQVALQLASSIPLSAEAQCIQGDALTMLGRFDLATAAYEKALTLDSGSTRAMTGLGRLRLGTDPMEAERLFLEVLQKIPRDTTALNNLGIARDLQHRHADAQTAYRQALGINPDMRAAQVNLALSLAMSGQGNQAIPLIQPLATAPDASRKLRHDYAAVLAMSGQPAEAEKILAADLSAPEVRQLLAEYASRPRNAPAEKTLFETTSEPAAVPGAKAP